MISIEEFPYGDERSSKNLMHEKTLLMRMNTVTCPFAVGYYNAIHDIFYVCCSPFINTENYYYDEHPVGGRYYSDHKCIMPKQFLLAKGPKTISEVMLMDDALADMEDRNLFNNDIDRILLSEKYLQPYMVITKDKHIIITHISAFYNYGTQFSGFEPSEINGTTYHCSSILPKDDIQFAVNLNDWYKRYGGTKK